MQGRGLARWALGNKPLERAGTQREKKLELATREEPGLWYMCNIAWFEARLEAVICGVLARIKWVETRGCIVNF